MMAIKGGNCIEAWLRIGVFLLLKYRPMCWSNQTLHWYPNTAQNQQTYNSLYRYFELEKMLFTWGTETDAS